MVNVFTTSKLDTDVPHRRSATWHNYSGGEAATPQFTFLPRTEDEVVEVVRLAISHRMNVRVVGGGYSFSPVVPTGGILIDTSDMRGLTGVDTATSRVRVRPGTRIYDLGDLLWDAGLSVSVQGMFDWQSIAGVVSTGTHGTGLDMPCMSGFVTWVRLVDGRGDVVEIGEDRLQELQAAQVSLGMLGVIVELELQAEPRFLLEKAPDYPSWAEAMTTVDEDLRHNRHYGLMWFPHDESSAMYSMPIPEESKKTDQCWRLIYRRAEGDPAQSDINRQWGPSVGRSYHIFSVKKDTYRKFQEMEYAVPLEQWRQAAEALRDLMRRSATPLFPLWLRWVRRDSSMISPFSERDSVTMSIAAEPGTDYWGFFQDYHALLSDFDARPHWGKIHLFDRDDVARLFPRHAEFMRIRAEFDPRGMFLNDHLRPLFS